MAIKPHHNIEYEEQPGPPTNNTQHNWQNEHQDDGRSLEVFWRHCMDLEQKVGLYWQRQQQRHHVFSNIHVLGTE